MTWLSLNSENSLINTGKKVTLKRFSDYNVNKYEFTFVLSFKDLKTYDKNDKLIKNDVLRECLAWVTVSWSLIWLNLIY